MKTTVLTSVLLTALLSACQQASTTASGSSLQAQVAATGMPALATISYWEASDYTKLPSGGIGLINPQDGIVGATPAQIATYKTVVQDAKKRGVKLLAYVPTGYGVRDPNADNSGGTKGQSIAGIKKQIDLYVSKFGAANLYGIFFDEADEPCPQAAAEYKQLSAYVRQKGLQVSAWNPGWVGDGFCFITAAPKGDIVVTYESDLNTYLTDPYVPNDVTEGNRVAHARGVKTWNLIHSAVGAAQLKLALDTLRARQPDYAYVTDLRDWTTGDNTWGAPPSYWDTELKCLLKGVCP